MMPSVLSKPEMHIIVDEQYVLRPLIADDLPFTLAWRNQESVRQCFLNTDVISMGGHLAWYEQYRHKTDDVTLILTRSDGLRIGQLAVYHIDYGKQEAEVGRFVVSPDGAGKGLMKKAIASLLAHLTSQYGLERIYLSVLAFNVSAIHLYLKLGFRVTGFEAGVVSMSLGKALHDSR
ncbi:MAG: GNAT family N-acetyltransferase [Formosimonas sp.]